MSDSFDQLKEDFLDVVTMLQKQKKKVMNHERTCDSFVKSLIKNNLKGDSNQQVEVIISLATSFVGLVHSIVGDNNIVEV